MANSKVAIQETFRLPSNGQLYNGTIPSEVRLRAMNTLDERTRLASTNPFKSTPKLIRNCLEGMDFDTEDLKIFDLYFLMFKLREVTYGPDYKVRPTCNSCGSSQAVVVNLSELETNFLEEGDIEPFDIELPVSGDHLGCKYLSSRDLNNLQNEVERMKSKAPDEDEADLSFIPGLASRIVTVNDEEWPRSKIVGYLQNMHARDYNYFEKKYIDITNKPGINLNYVSTCPKCGAPIIFEVPVLSEFFRPSID
ncbi:hypothetical protein [uncultured Clostridium sp.]|uniref:T4 family baseplate hub assembly chaperone n=1 Tax=uncultured Clostridium sp. TaxID=59620 RepID=UPI00260296A5|nr:hypothetical protein [uncultured Clostridium sp.]